MNKSVFGKPMGNIRNYKAIKFVTSQEKCVRYVMKTNFKDWHPFSKELFACRDWKNRDQDE